MEMFLKVNYLLLLLYVILVTVNAQTVQDYYTGAVVEYAPTYNKSLTPMVNSQNNINEYEKFIKSAKAEGADIIVFPECGLTTTKYVQDLHFYTSVLPDPKNNTVACGTENTWSNVLVRLSCLAKDNSIYLVVNLPERMILDAQKKIYKIFNSNIVLDRKGALIARYRKYNLFNEPGFNVTENPDLTYFETDFGVTFGTFTCFDILFAKPSLDLLKKYENITDIVFPTAWFSELPFLTGVQTQVGWARANGVNFLAAGYSDPKNTGGGSGIYQAIGNILYNIPVQNVSSVIIQKIKKITKRVNPQSFDANTAISTKTNKNNNPDLMLDTTKENMKEYKTELLNKSVADFKLCHEEDTLCCTFTVKFDSQAKEDYYYRMVVYYGPRAFSTETHNVQICGIAACKTQSSDSCGERISSPSNPKLFKEISIKGEFLDQGGSVIFPTNVLYDLGVLAPSNFTFTRNENRVEMKTTTEVKDLLGFGIYSVTKDSPIPVPKGLAGGVIAIIVIAVLIIVALIGLFIWRRFKNGNYKHAMVN